MANWLFLLLLVIGVDSVTSVGSGKIAFVTWNKDTDSYQVLQNSPPSDFVAVGEFSNAVNTTGWSFLNVTTIESYPDEVQAFAAGLVEGFLTGDQIKMHWDNTVKGYCESPLSDYCQRLQDFLQQNIYSMEENIYNQTPLTNNYWKHVKLYLLQVSGLNNGFGYYHGQPIGKPTTSVKPTGEYELYFLQVSGDLEDLEVKLNRPQLSKVFGSGSCSALVKMLPAGKELFVSHDTWSSYQSMLRILKNYDLPLHDLDGYVVKGRQMRFSSYPGVVMSGDDYYIMNSGLVAMETTIGNSNMDLMKYITPIGTVMEGIRSMVANRLAYTGLQWANIFTTYNSGTYNNEWMIVDYKMFQPGSNSMKDLLVVVEQIPGQVMFDDMTNVLLNQGYWPSYNVPYFPSVFNNSGCPANVKKFGDWFSYDKTPRALIFKRDHMKVKDIDSMMHLMRYNNYTQDPLSRCNCTPPYSAENAISARCDLNPANGVYPIAALGHRSHGGTDMKVTSYAMYKDNMKMMAVSGPTYDSLPPFQWSKADFAKDCPHAGHPDIFKFQPIVFDGSVNFKYYQGNY